MSMCNYGMWKEQCWITKGWENWKRKGAEVCLDLGVWLLWAGQFGLGDLQRPLPTSLVLWFLTMGKMLIVITCEEPKYGMEHRCGMPAGGKKLEVYNEVFLYPNVTSHLWLTDDSSGFYCAGLSQWLEESNCCMWTWPGTPLRLSRNGNYCWWLLLLLQILVMHE